MEGKEGGRETDRQKDRDRETGRDRKEVSLNSKVHTPVPVAWGF